MDPINDIPIIGNNGAEIPDITINGTGIPQIKPVGTKNISISNIGIERVWLITPPQAVPIEVPVTELIGTPIVNMPGCVKVSKENNYPNPNNRNKQLVNDDPKGNTVLCDAGAPYYEPPNYDARGLSWETITTETDEEPQGVNTGDPPAPNTDTPDPPTTPPDDKEVECPPPNARRIGDANQAGTERVKEYKLTPDKLICETIWEPIPTVEQFIPPVPVISTTATIAAVATTSALLAKPLADLLLKVVKPVIKKVLGKVQSLLGKTPHRPNLAEQRTNRYREKKGMLPINFGKKKKPLKKTDESK